MQTRKNPRLKNYNYSTPTAYFITICTHKRECIFGEITNGVMTLNKTGEIIKQEWLKTGLIRPYVYLDEYMIMPNHLHGIIHLGERAPQRGAPTVGTIVCQFKSACTKRIGLPIWQRNYHDHVIRHEKSLNETRQYILNNPAQWHLDKNNPANL